MLSKRNYFDGGLQAYLSGIHDVLKDIAWEFPPYLRHTKPCLSSTPGPGTPVANERL